jgi:hypothetical protein
VKEIELTRGNVALVDDVDNHPVEKAYFDTEVDALTWCIGKQLELAVVVRA